MASEEVQPTLTKQPKDVLVQCKEMLDKGERRQALVQLEALTLVLTNNHLLKKELALAYVLKAETHLNLSEFTKAQDSCNKAMIISRELKDVSIEASSLRILGNMCWKRGELQTALEDLIRALQLAVEIKDPALEGTIRVDKATVLGHMGDIGASERDFREAMLLLEKAGDLRELARAYNNLANTIMNTKNWERAAQMFAKSKKLCEKLGDAPSAAFAGLNLAECLIEMGQWKNAIEELDIIYPVIEKAGDTYALLAVTHTYGLAHAKAKEWPKAEEYMIKARRLSQKASIPMAEAKVIADIGRMFKWRGDKEKAQLYLKEAIEIYSRMGAKREVQGLLDEIKER